MKGAIFYFAKMTFSYVLEEIAQKIFLGETPDPQLSSSSLSLSLSLSLTSLLESPQDCAILQLLMAGEHSSSLIEFCYLDTNETPA